MREQIRAKGKAVPGAEREVMEFVAALEGLGFRFTLTRNGRGVEVRGPRDRMTRKIRRALRVGFPAIRDLLRAEENPI